MHEKAFDNLAETLEELILSFNELTIFPFLKRLKNLHVINLNNNTVTIFCFYFILFCVCFSFTTFLSILLTD